MRSGGKKMQPKSADQDGLNNYGGWTTKSNVCTTHGVYIHSLALEETTRFSRGSAGLQLFKAWGNCVYSATLKNEHWHVIHRQLERVIFIAQVGKLQWSLTGCDRGLRTSKQQSWEHISGISILRVSLLARAIISSSAIPQEHKIVQSERQIGSSRLIHVF